MFIQDCFYFNELADYNFSEDYLEMMEYTIKAFKEGRIHEDLTISDMAVLKMEMIDLDAIRWYRGELTTKELFEKYKAFFMRQ